MKKYFRDLILVLVTAVVSSSIGVYAYSLSANQVVYKPTDKTWKVSNVNDAIESLKLSKTGDNYSTTEKEVGTWIDGKPIYQKTIKYSWNQNATTPYIYAVPTDVDQYVNVFMNTTLHLSSGEDKIMIILPYYGGSDDYFYVDRTNASLKSSILSSTQYYTNTSITYIYTKTTDNVSNS